MKRIILTSALALSLGACAGIPGVGIGTGATSTDTVETIKALSAHMGQCERHYQGGIGLGGSFTFNVDCKATAIPLRDVTDVDVRP